MHALSRHLNGTRILAAVYLLIVTIAGCSSGSSEYSAAPAQPAPAAAGDNGSAAAGKKDSPILGVWEGTTLAACGGVSLPDRCNAQQIVKITLIEGDDAKIGGFYKCSYGNMDCYDLNTSGKVVDAGMSGNQISMRVMMLDGTSCRFNGRVSNNAVLGGYSCFTGASQFEQGTWRAQHSY
jgi:hypothetical protein